MNSKAKSVLKSFSYSFTANITSMVISMVLVAFVPKFFGPEEYSYWQLYIFYTGFVGFFHFGWADGIYLRHGGREYDKLDRSMFHAQFWLLVFFEIIIAAGLSVFIFIFVNDADKSLILLLTALCCVLVLPRTMLQYILQGTNRIKDYARNLIAEKVMYGVLVVVMLVVGVRTYSYLLLADIFAKAVTLVLMCISCKDIVVKKGLMVVAGIKEAWANIGVGIKLMFANVASLLIVGIVRYAIEWKWDVKVFGKVSLAMSVSNMMMLFITAISIVVFPILKRMPQEKWAGNYRMLRALLVMPMLGLLILYYPAKVVLSAWLPKYAESLVYMALMFPMCMYEGKMSLLTNTFMKAMRMEKYMLITNMVTLVLSVASTVVTVVWLGSLPLAVVSITILLTFRSVFSELILTKKLSIRIWLDLFLELALTALFIASGWFIQSWLSVAVYAAAYLVYLILRYKNVKFIFKTVRSMLKS